MEYLKYFTNIDAKCINLSKILARITNLNEYISDETKSDKERYKALIEGIRHDITKLPFTNFKILPTTNMENMILLQNLVKKLVDYIDQEIMTNNNLCCVIDDITFKIEGKNNHDSKLLFKRSFVSICSYKNNCKTSFVAYKSASQFGLWKVCTYNNKILWKGTDQMSTTMLHFDLQCFINANWNDIPVIEIVLKSDVAMENLLDTESRILLDGYMSRLADLNMNDCFENQKQLFDSTYDWLIKNVTKAKASDFFHTARTEDCTMLYEHIRIYLNYFIGTNFKIEGTPEVTMNLYSGLCSGQIKKITIVHKNDNYKLSVYYYDYKFSGDHYTIPVFVCPPRTKITYFGTPTLYVPVGIYLYRPYEIMDKCNRSLSHQKMNKHDYFAGEKYKNWWYPFNTINSK
jgi:hypothetical protein